MRFGKPNHCPLSRATRRISLSTCPSPVSKAKSIPHRGARAGHGAARIQASEISQTRTRMHRSEAVLRENSVSRPPGRRARVTPPPVPQKLATCSAIGVSSRIQAATRKRAPTLKPAGRNLVALSLSCRDRAMGVPAKADSRSHRVPACAGTTIGKTEAVRGSLSYSRACRADATFTCRGSQAEVESVALLRPELSYDFDLSHNVVV